VEHKKNLEELKVNGVQCNFGPRWLSVYGQKQFFKIPSQHSLGSVLKLF